MSTRRCTGQNRKGEPCKAAPLKNRDVCLAHADAKTRQSVGFVSDNGKAGRPKQPRVTDVYADELHRRVGEHIDDLIGRLVAIALEAERTVVVGTGPNARTEIAPDQGLQLAALRELNDRILGRPRQYTELTGAHGGPIETAHIPTTDDHAAEVARILVETGAVSLEANGNGNGNGHH